MACAGAGHFAHGPKKMLYNGSPCGPSLLPCRVRFTGESMHLPDASRTSRSVSPSSARPVVSFSHISTTVVWLDEPCVKTPDVLM